MDSHSRSASPREQSRPLHRPPSPPLPAAPRVPQSFDNKGYQHDEADPNHNDSFSSNPSQQNGHNKEPNGDTKTHEAVNLELINMTPKNGNAKQKKDVEVDINGSSPYDEYFVPVNEHKKYMRGEKLYVTADKRGEKGGCKRPLCWTLLGLVVAVIVALIVLAATGVIFTSNPTPLDPHNVSISSARAFNGIGNVQNDGSDHDHNHDHDHVHNHDHDHDQDHNHDHDHDHKKEDPVHIQENDQNHHEDTVNQTAVAQASSEQPEAQDDEARENVLPEEVTDSSAYVPRVLEGVLKVDNKDYLPQYQDTESDEYREFVNDFSEPLMRALFDRNTIENSTNDIAVGVIELSPGSIVVTYRVIWKPRSNSENTDNLLTADTLKAKLNDYLDKNNRMISIYHIAEDPIVTRRVLDVCQINRNDCQHECEFDETYLDFKCTCPPGEILDMQNEKTCVSYLDNPSVTEHNTEMAKITTESSFATTVVSDEIENTELIPNNEGSKHPLDTSTDNPDINFSHILNQNTKKEDELEPTSKINLSNTEEPTLKSSTFESSSETKEMFTPILVPITSTEHVEMNTHNKPLYSYNPSINEPDLKEITKIVNDISKPEPSTESINSETLRTTTSTLYQSSSQLESAVEVNPGLENENTHLFHPEDRTTTEFFNPYVFNNTTNSYLATQMVSETEIKEPSTTLKPRETVKPQVSQDMETREHITSNNEINDIESKNHELKHNSTDEAIENIPMTTTPTSMVYNITMNPNSSSVSNENPKYYTVLDHNTGNNNQNENSEVEDDWLTTHILKFTENTESELETTKYPQMLNKETVTESRMINMETTSMVPTKDTTDNDKKFNPEIISTHSKENNLILTVNNTEEKQQNIVTESYVLPTTTSPILSNTLQYTLNVKSDTSNDNEKEVTESASVTGILDRDINNSPSVASPFNVENYTVSSEVPKNIDYPKTEISPEISSIDDETTITFGDIHARLYNRSSKSIENKNENDKRQKNTSNEVNQSMNNKINDWVPSSVTEIQYEETMNKMGTFEPTESIPQVSDIMNSAKDDNEPDYLNNMDTKYTKLPEQYDQHDNEDTRIKRINEESVEKSHNTTLEDTSKYSTPASVSDFIYTTTERHLNNPILPSVNSNVDSSSVYSDTLPVSKSLDKNESNISEAVTEEAIIPTTTTPIDTLYRDTFSNSVLQNNTQTNKLDFAIYETLRHSTNHPLSSSNHTNPHSAEYEDHETEMNPFLPEAENNKNLVKNLQEGHDLEPPSFSETQNENNEEHTLNTTTERNLILNNDMLTTLLPSHEATESTSESSIIDFQKKNIPEGQVTSKENQSVVPEEETTEKSNGDNTVATNTPKAVLPFLTDTEDIYNSNPPALNPTLVNISTDFPASTSTFFSGAGNWNHNNVNGLNVLPIDMDSDESTITKNLNSENVQGLNAISDTPENSVLRTVDVNNPELSFSDNQA